MSRGSTVRGFCCDRDGGFFVVVCCPIRKGLRCDLVLCGSCFSSLNAECPRDVFFRQKAFVFFFFSFFGSVIQECSKGVRHSGSLFFATNIKCNGQLGSEVQVLCVCVCAIRKRERFKCAKKCENARLAWFYFGFFHPFGTLFGGREPFIINNAYCYWAGRIVDKRSSESGRKRLCDEYLEWCRDIPSAGSVPAGT